MEKLRKAHIWLTELKQLPTNLKSTTRPEVTQFVQNLITLYAVYTRHLSQGIINIIFVI